TTRFCKTPSVLMLAASPSRLLASNGFLGLALEGTSWDRDTVCIDIGRFLSLGFAPGSDHSPPFIPGDPKDKKIGSGVRMHPDGCQEESGRKSVKAGIAGSGAAAARR